MWCHRDPLFQRTCPLPLASNSTFIPHCLSEFSKLPFFPLLMDTPAVAITPGSNQRAVYGGGQHYSCTSSVIPPLFGTNVHLREAPQKLI